VPTEQAADGRGKGSYPLSLTLTLLNHLLEAPSVSGLDEATSIIRSHDVVDEFLACGLWPLSEKFGFKVETKETPLSKVVVPMPQVTAVTGTQEPGAEFEACITNTTNLLVGNYNVTEHNTCQGLRHGQVNYVFELAGVLYQPHPEPMVWKHKSTGTLPPSTQKEFRKNEGIPEGHPVLGLRPLRKSSL
jgi:hypothetical protein